MPVKTSLLLCLLLLGLALGIEREREQKVKKEQKEKEPLHNKARSSVGGGGGDGGGGRDGGGGGGGGGDGGGGNVAAAARAQARSGPRQNKGQAKRLGSNKVAKSQKKVAVAAAGPRNDAGCTDIGGICQRNTYVCQGRYLKEKCAGSTGRQCCMPAAGAWEVFCAGHYHNRVRACDRFGCGAFNSDRNGGRHKGVDIVCDDYGNINAPFSGTLGGPVGRRGVDGIQFDGVKLSNSAQCVKIFNIRPLRYTGPISQGDTLGYLLPLQERFSGITSHLELQMCDLSDPTPFI